MFRIALFLSCLLASSASAGLIHRQGGGATGKAQINIGVFEAGPQEYINIFKSAGKNFGGGATPDVLDINQYVVKSFTGQVNEVMGGTGFGLSTAGPYIVAWAAGRSNFHFECLALANVNAGLTQNATVINGSGSGNFQFLGDGVHAGSVTFTFTSVPTNGLTCRFDGDSGTQVYASGSGDMTMMRVSDVTAYNAGEIFTPEYVSAQTGLLAQLHAESIRMTGQINTSGGGSSEVKWVCRAAPTTFSWNSGVICPEQWSGGSGSSGTISNTLAAYTAAPAPDTPLSGWVDGEVFIGNVTNAITSPSVSGAASNSGNVQFTVSTTANMTNGQTVWIQQVGGTTEANVTTTVSSIDSPTTFTIPVAFVHAYTSGGFVGIQSIVVTGKTGGAKLLGGFSGQFPFPATLSGLSSFHYDAILDRVLQAPVTSSVPIEVHAALANKINANLWEPLPAWADDDYVTNWATAARTALNPVLFFKPEYSNEAWNPGFPQANWSTARGTALGFSQANLSYYGLRYRQVMGIVTPIWSGRNLRRVLANQMAISNLSNDATNRWKGNELGSFGGGTPYNVKPNRPIDFAESLAYAPYAIARNLCASSPDAQCALTAANAPFLQNLANLWNAGSSAAAIAQVDNDIRQGQTLVQTVTASGTILTTPLAHGFTAASTIVSFNVTGGSSYGGLNSGQAYSVDTTPTSTTFTIKAFGSTGQITGSAINSGTAAIGTVSVGSIGSTFGGFANAVDMQGRVDSAYISWETAAAAFDSDRPAAALPLRIEWYEGAIEVTGCTAAQCLAIGVTLPGDPTGATAAAAINAAILAWRNDPMSAATIQVYYNQFMGTDPNMAPTFGVMPHSKIPSNLLLLDGSVWALTPDNNLGSAPWQLYNGVQNYNLH